MPDERADLVGGHDVGHRPADAIGQGRRADRLEVLARRMAPTPRILQLGHQPAILVLDRARPAPQAILIVRIPGPHPGSHFLMGRARHRLGDQQRCTATRTIQVILDQPVGDAPVRGGYRAHCRVEDAVAQAPTRQGDRGEKTRVKRHGLSLVA